MHDSSVLCSNSTSKAAHVSAGYQYLVAVFFLIVFPLNVLLRSFAATVTVLYSWKNAGMLLIDLRYSWFVCYTVILD